MSRSLQVLQSSNLVTPIKKTSDRMDKSINLNPVGNINSFGSSIYSTLSVEIIEGSINCSHLSEVD